MFADDRTLSFRFPHTDVTRIKLKLEHELKIVWKTNMRKTCSKLTLKEKKSSQGISKIMEIETKVSFRENELNFTLISNILLISLDKNHEKD